MKARRILKKLNYLPRWAWYIASLAVAFPVGPVFVYLAFHVLEKAAQDEREEAPVMDWDVDIDDHGVHVRRSRRRYGRRQAQNVYQDEECTVTGDEDVAARWQQTEESARHAQSQTKAPADEDDCAGVIREGREVLRSIRYANDLIPDPALSAQIDSIERSCEQILSILEQRPTLLPQLRTFLRYYLPTTLKLLDARARLENSASTPKAREVSARISEALGVIDKAFARQVEALDAYRFIDLESEMDVLRDMLRADGLIDDPTDAQDDPFAQVLSGRASSSTGGTPMASH